MARSFATLGIVLVALWHPDLESLLLVTMTCTLAQALWQLWRLHLLGVILHRTLGGPSRDYGILLGLARWRCWLPGYCPCGCRSTPTNTPRRGACRKPKSPAQCSRLQRYTQRTPTDWMH